MEWWFVGFRHLQVTLVDHRGLQGMEDILSIGNFQTSISPGESTLFAFSTNADPVLDESQAWQLKVVADNAILSDAKALPKEIRPWPYQPINSL